MRFELSEDQQEIQRSARELLAGRSSFAQVRAAAEAGRADAPGESDAPQGMGDLLAAGGSGTEGEDPALWSELGELGWTGIAIAEEHGGQGLGLIELASIVEELGYAVAPVPFLGSALAGLLVQHDGSDEQREDWLGHLASGELRGAVTLTGDAVPVPGADESGLVIVAQAPGGPIALYGPGSGIVEPVVAIDPTRGHGRVPVASLDAEEDPDGRAEWLGGTTTPGAGLDRATVVVAAELVGVAQRALDLTVEYVKQRKQFGVPVGSFQAVQHGAAQMLRDVQLARVLTYHAAWVADAGDPAELPVAAAMAKAAASDAGRTVTAQAIQLHGGIGFTWEADLHWLMKRAQIDAVLLGGAGHHRRRIANVIAPVPAAAEV